MSDQNEDWKEHMSRVKKKQKKVLKKKKKKKKKSIKEEKVFISSTVLEGLFIPVKFWMHDQTSITFL